MYIEKVEQTADDFVDKIETSVLFNELLKRFENPKNREHSLVKTKLQEARMWYIEDFEKEYVLKSYEKGKNKWVKTI